MSEMSEDLPLLENSREMPRAPHAESIKSQIIKPYLKPGGIGLGSAISYMIGLFGVVPIIVIPGAIAYAGPLGFIMVAALISTLAYTSILLSKAWLIFQAFWPEEIRHCRHPYPTLAEKAGGIIFKRVVTVMQSLSIFGASVPFLLLSSEFLQNLVLGLSKGQVYFSFCYWMVIVTVCLVPITWLGTPSDFTLLAWVGAGSVIATTVLCLVGLFVYAPDTVQYPPLLPTWKSFAYAFGSVAFQFDIHTTILTVQMDMKQTFRMPLVLVCAYGVGFILFGAVSLSGFILYGDSLQTNFLHNFPAGGLLLHFLMAIIAIQSLICLILGINPLMQNLEEVMGMPDCFGWRRVLLRTAVMFLLLFVCEAVPDFGLAIELVGGLLITPLAFIFPPLFYLLIKHKTSGRLNIKEVIVCVHIILFGIIGCLGATIESLLKLVHIEEFAPPCFFNASASLTF